MIAQFFSDLELFRHGFFASLVLGAVLPLVGTVLFLRRSAFLGVAVPQFSAAGLALGLLALPWFSGPWAEYLEHGHPPTWYLFVFTASAALAALLVFARIEAASRRGGSEARLAAGFVLASALALVFLSASAVGPQFLEAYLRGGQILLVDSHGLEIGAGVFALVLLGLWALRRPVLLIAFDPDAAVAFGLPVARYEASLLLLLGLAIAGGVMTAGPVLVFGLLFLPPLAARQVAGSIPGFLVLSVLVSLLSVLGAWPVSLYCNQPYGPGAVLLASLLAVCSWAAGRRRRAP